MHLFAGSRCVFEVYGHLKFYIAQECAELLRNASVSFQVTFLHGKSSLVAEEKQPYVRLNSASE